MAVLCGDWMIVAETWHCHFCVYKCKFYQGQVLLAETVYQQESSGQEVVCAPELYVPRLHVQIQDFPLQIHHSSVLSVLISHLYVHWILICWIKCTEFDLTPLFWISLKIWPSFSALFLLEWPSLSPQHGSVSPQRQFLWYSKQTLVICSSDLDSSQTAIMMLPRMLYRFYPDMSVLLHVTA